MMARMIHTASKRQITTNNKFSSSCVNFDLLDKRENVFEKLKKVHLKEDFLEYNNILPTYSS